MSGSYAKYFGVPGSPDGPFFYLVRHDPGARIPRHTHAADVMHYLVAGLWLVGEPGQQEPRLPGYFHWEPKGTYWGPVEAGSEGSTVIAIYSGCPDFIPAGEQDS